MEGATPSQPRVSSEPILSHPSLPPMWTWGEVSGEVWGRGGEGRGVKGGAEGGGEERRRRPPGAGGEVSP